MKFKIISDGTNVGTKLIDEDTGQIVPGVQKLTWEADINDFNTKVSIEFCNISVEIASKAEVNLLEYDQKYADFAVSKTFDKNIKIVAEDQDGKTITVFKVKVFDANDNHAVGAVQSIKWEATPQGTSAKVKRIKIDNKDW